MKNANNVSMTALASSIILFEAVSKQQEKQPPKAVALVKQFKLQIRHKSGRKVVQSASQDETDMASGIF